MDTTTFILLGIAALALVVVWTGRKPVTDPADVYYDPDEALPATPQPWGRDDYQPWPGLYDDPEAEIEAVTALWNEAVNDGDTILTSALFEEYERLCRAYR